MAVNAASYRVLYRDIDSMGVLYYGRYLAMFEMGRVEWMRSEGCRYRDLEREHGVLLPVTKASCSYLAPVEYDDLLIVRTEIVRWSASRITFSHRLIVPSDAATASQALAKGSGTNPFPEDFWEDSRHRLCALGEVELGCVRKEGMRPTRIPGPFRKLLTDRAPDRLQPRPRS
ncbi:MAG: acyl-CoA thioesterase [Planctomycetes bacterium]|nr:acyl-CoA thioesterase [Planctomycetota bacterium]